MAGAVAGEITQLLRRARQGASEAHEQLWERLYPQPRRLAERCCRSERGGHTLTPPGVIHEAYLRLIEQAGKYWQNRAHLIGLAAAQVMRRILIDYARSHRADKRGGAYHQIGLHEAFVLAPDLAEQLLALAEALEHLAALDLRQSRTVELRFLAASRIEKPPQYWKSARGQ